MKRASLTPLLLLLSAWLCSARAPENNQLEKSEESVEHEVDEREALFLAKELFRFKAPAKLGCGTCSSQDMDYCWGPDLLQDHCCCDHNLPEKFPYIPHICYKHQVPLCRTIVENCEEYVRIDTCCCQPYLRPHWQYHSWTKSKASSFRPISAIIAYLVMVANLLKYSEYL